MAYSVTKRQREIGVRLALGAAPSGIQRMIFLQAGRLAAIGLLVGLTLSMMLGQFLSKLLFGVTPFDVPTLRYGPDGPWRGEGTCLVASSEAGNEAGPGGGDSAGLTSRRSGATPEGKPASLEATCYPLVEVLQATERRVVAGR